MLCLQSAPQEHPPNPAHSLMLCLGMHNPGRGTGGCMVGTWLLMAEPTPAMALGAFAELRRCIYRFNHC